MEVFYLFINRVEVPLLLFLRFSPNSTERNDIFILFYWSIKRDDRAHTGMNVNKMIKRFERNAFRFQMRGLRRVLSFQLYGALKACVEFI